MLCSFNSYSNGHILHFTDGGVEPQSPTGIWWNRNSNPGSLAPEHKDVWGLVWKQPRPQQAVAVHRPWVLTLALPSLKVKGQGRIFTTTLLITLTMEAN